MEPQEQDGQIFVLIIDETYGVSEENWDEESEKYRLQLSEEFDADFEETNIGPGVDIPAFLTIIDTLTAMPVLTIAIGAFFLGKPINENLKSWLEMGGKLRSFFHRPVFLARHGASVLAVAAVFEEMGGEPRTVRLKSYRVGHIGDDDLSLLPRSDEIHENTQTVNLGFVRHVFEIEADGRTFRVGVIGKETTVLPL